MSVVTAAGSIALNTGANGATTVTGKTAPAGGWKIAMIWVTRKTGADGYLDDMAYSMGFAVAGSVGRVVDVMKDNGQGTAHAGEQPRSDGVICMMQPVFGVNNDFATAFTAFTSDGFTVTHFGGSAPDGAYIMNYWLIGGSDITDVEVGHVSIPTTTGNFSKTGMTYKPDITFLMHSGEGGSFPSQQGGKMGFGAFTKEGDQFAWAVTDIQGTAQSHTGVVHVEDACLIEVDVNGSGVASQLARANFVSMNTDGWTINVTDAPAASLFTPYLSIKGGIWKIGSDTVKSSTGTKSRTGLGFRPKGVLYTGTQQSDASIHGDTNACWFHGAFDGTNSACACGIYGFGSFGRGTQGQFSNAIIVHSTTAPAVQQSATKTSSTLDSDGYTLNYDTANGAVPKFAYIAVGDTPFPAGMPSVLGSTGATANGGSSPYGGNFSPPVGTKCVVAMITFRPGAQTTGVTASFDGVPMTKIAEVGTDGSQHAFILNDPPVGGSRPVTFTKAGHAGDYLWAVAAVDKNYDTTHAVVVANTQGNNDLSVNITPNEGLGIIFSLISHENAVGPTPTGGQTLILSNNGFGWARAAAYELATAAGGTQSDSWNNGTLDHGSLASVYVDFDAPPPPPPPPADVGSGLDAPTQAPKERPVDVTIPHFSLPFHFADQGTGYPTAAVVQQDSDEEVVNCVEAIIRYSPDQRIEKPDFGTPDTTFGSPQPDIEVIRSSVAEFEPRADLAISQGYDPVDEGLNKIRLEVENQASRARESTDV